MEGRAVDHLRSLALAMLAAALAGVFVVLTPLLVGAVRAQRTEVDVVSLRNYPDIDDHLLRKELKEAGAPSGVLLIIPPDGHFTGQPFECTNDRLPQSCPVLKEYRRHVVLGGAGTGVEALNAIYGEGTADDGEATYVRSGRQPLHGTFAWGAATKVGLVMALFVAAAFFVVLRAGPRRLRPAAPGPGPAGSSAPGPAAEPAPARHMSAPAVPPAPSVPLPSAPPPSAPPPARKPPPPAEPLPADAVPPAGHRVVARTHFGAHGGYVDADGVVLWASLAQPADGAYPGQQLTVVGPDHGRHGLVVSHQVTEEVRP